MAQGKEPKQSELVTNLMEAAEASACDLPKLVVVRGFLAEGPTATDDTQRWRVYLNHALTDYYEIESEADIVYWMDVGDEDEGQRVWLRHGAKTRYVRTRASEAEVPQLLGGRIAQTLMPVAPPPAPAYYGQGYHVQQPQPSDWLPIDDLYGFGGLGGPYGYEVSRCSQGCYSASP